jgi:hypothetical protein
MVKRNLRLFKPFTIYLSPFTSSTVAKRPLNGRIYTRLILLFNYKFE